MGGRSLLNYAVSERLIFPVCVPFTIVVLARVGWVWGRVGRGHGGVVVGGKFVLELDAASDIGTAARAALSTRRRGVR